MQNSNLKIQKIFWDGFIFLPVVIPWQCRRKFHLKFFWFGRKYVTVVLVISTQLMELVPLRENYEPNIVVYAEILYPTWYLLY